MSSTVCIELRFWLPIGLSFIAPAALCALLSMRARISRGTVLALGLALVAISGVDVYLLQVLEMLAKRSPRW